jgi:hypothetical protein
MLPHKERDPLSLAVLIGANLIPLAGVFLFRWDISFIVLLYWMENLIVGFYNILKMATLKTKNRTENHQKLVLIPFFCLHFGGFCAVHGFFLTVFFKIGPQSSPFTESSHWWGPLIFLQLLFSVIAKLWAARPPDMIWAVLGLFISHGVSFVENYILGGEYKEKDMRQLMQQPYQRIFIMHFAILAGGIFILQQNSPLPLMIILILLKIFLDMHLHKKSHTPKQNAKPTGEKTASRNGKEIPG